MKKIHNVLFSRSIIILALVNFATLAYAQKPPRLPGDYPNRSIRIVLGFAPGGGVDIVMRVFAQQLSEAWGITVVVENRPGASGAIAMGLVAKAIPDGYTMLGGVTPTIMYSMLLGTAPYDILKVYVPVVKLSSQSYLLLVGPSLPVNSVKELIALAKSKPGGLSYASTGVGTSSNLGMESFMSLTGITAVHVPYKAINQALPDMISGQISMAFGLVVSSLPQVKNGRLKALAVAAPRRSQLLPNLPTIAEAGGPNFELSTEYGLFAPAGTPSAIVVALNKESTRIMNSPQMKERLATDGAEAAPPAAPAEYKESLARNLGALSKLIKSSAFKAE